VEDNRLVCETLQVDSGAIGAFERDLLPESCTRGGLMDERARFDSLRAAIFDVAIDEPRQGLDANQNGQADSDARRVSHL
jgi:hypothetical protein